MQKRTSRHATIAVGPKEATPESVAVEFEKCAEIEFEPWSAEDLESCEPMNNDDFAKASLHWVVYIRVAWSLLAKSKPELINLFRNNEVGETMSEFSECVTEAIALHEHQVAILKAAQARIFIAASAAIMRSGGGSCVL